MAITKLTTAQTEQERIVVQNTNNAFLSSSMPIGAILPFGGTVAPLGTLFADGSAVSRSTYSALFDVIGTSYGVGDGAETFNLPDMRGNVAVGKDSTTEFNTLGKTGGEKTHTLTESELPKVSGTITMHSAANGTNIGAVDGVFSSSVNPTDYKDGGNPSPGEASVGVVDFNLGSDGAHNNLPPYLVSNYIVIYAGGVSQATIDASLQGAKDYTDGKLADIIIKVTKSGTVITANDVLSVIHNPVINLSSESISDFSSVIVKRYGVNLLDSSVRILGTTVNGITVQYLPAEDVYLFNGTATASGQINLIRAPFPSKNGEYYTCSTIPVSGTVSESGTAVVYLCKGDIETTYTNWLSTNLRGGNNTSTLDAKYVTASKFYFFVRGNIG